MSQHSRTGAASPNKEWIPKAEAAKLAGVSARQIERRVSQGMIQSRTLDRPPGAKAGAVEYSRADVEALIAGRPNNHARIVRTPEQLPAKPAAAIATLPERIRNNHLAGLPEMLKLLAPIASQRPAEPKPWLTLAEAVEYSGLPKSFLHAMAEGSGERRAKIAINVGTELRKSWRFSRSALQTL